MASQKSKGPNGERGGRLMKAMMCEANRKEDRMCGKQTERRQPSGKGHNAQLSGSVWSGRRRQGFWGERATFLLPPQCHWALHGAQESWEKQEGFPADCCWWASYGHLQLCWCGTHACQWVNQVGSPRPSPPPAQRDAWPLSIHFGIPWWWKAVRFPRQSFCFDNILPFLL